jgi:hypothetical protein
MAESNKAIVSIVSVSVVFPFGKHKDEPLANVPASYLLWSLRDCKLSSGLRAAVAGELQRRGFDRGGAHYSTDRLGRALGLLLKTRRARFTIEKTEGRSRERWFAAGGAN